MKTSRITCLAIATLLTCGSFARAESLVHVDQLAVTAEWQARRVFSQTHSLHAYGPAAQQLKENALQMIRLASHIHEVAHVNQRIDHHRIDHYRGRQFGIRIDRQAHINRDVAELDRLMHEMQDMVVRMKARTAVRRTAYGRPGVGNVAVYFGRHFALNFNTHGTSHAHHGTSFRAPSTLDRIEFSLAKLSETVHHLLEDTEVPCIRKR